MNGRMHVKKLQQVEAWENEPLSNQARMAWMRDGDKNSKFYHVVINEKRRSSTTQIARPDGTDAKEIGELAEQYYKPLFQAGDYFLEDELFSGIHPAISHEENEQFCRIPSLEKIWQMIQQLNPDTAPGKDGFAGHFYRTCWDIIKVDLHEMVVDFLGVDIYLGISPTPHSS